MSNNVNKDKSIEVYIDLDNTYNIHDNCKNLSFINIKCEWLI